MEILAHRTAMANAPPNSLEGLNFCWSQGVRVVECDVSFTKDEKPIVWHDEDNHRLKPSIESINELTLAEIRRLKRKDSDESLLGLDNVFEFLKTHPAFRVLFDVKCYFKRYGIETDLWGVVGQIPMRFINLTFQHVVWPAVFEDLENQIGFVTFDGGIRLLQEVKENRPSIFTSLIVVQPWFQIADCLKYTDALTIGWGWHGRNHWRFFPGSVERLANEAHQNSRAVWGGLVRNESDIEWLAYHGFDGVWADDINMVREVLAAEI